MSLRRIAEGVHVAETDQRFFGLEMGARMTVLDAGGDLLVHSPIAIDPHAVASLGNPRWVLAPNLFHHLYAGPWIDAGLEGWGAPGLAAKRTDLRFEGEVEPGTSPFGPDIEVLPIRSFSLTNEVLVLHRPSRTLVVTDFVANIAADAPWLTRFAMRCMGGYPGCRVTWLERLGMRRAIARTELATLAGWDFDRVIMAHGQVIERGGKQALLKAFAWLGDQAALRAG